MKLTPEIRIPNLELFILFLCMLNCISGRRFDPNYYPQEFYEGQQKIKTALSKLEHAPQWVSNWPNPDIKLGQVSGLALDNSGQLLVFHRATNTWDENTFNDRNVYQDIGKPAIPYPTVLVLNDTGELVDQWGENLFHIPHGITVDTKGNVFVTDVALHQVFRFTAGNWKQPELVLGEKFIPGEDFNHFCKPSAVAVLPTGEFFVADGYCNHRILKMAPDGTIILHWGTAHGDSPFSFNVPHALTLADDRDLVCVADREHGRVECFRTDNGTFVDSYSSWLIGGRLFSVAYAPIHGGRLYIVNGPARDMVPVRGYVVDLTSGRLIATFAPDLGLSNPHDVIVSPDGSKVYVAELDPHRVHKFFDASLHNESRAATAAAAQPSARNNTVRAKPTATVEVSGPAAAGGGWEWWWGAAGGAGGAAAAALLALAAAALRQARNKEWPRKATLTSSNAGGDYYKMNGTLARIRVGGAATIGPLHSDPSGRKSVSRRRWEYGQGEFKLRRLLERRRFTRVHSEDSDEEPAPMLPHPPANA